MFSNERATPARISKKIGVALGVGARQATRLGTERRKRHVAAERGDLATRLSFRAIRAVNVHLGLRTQDRPGRGELIAAPRAMTNRQLQDAPDVGLQTAEEVRA